MLGKYMISRQWILALNLSCMFASSLSACADSAPPTGVNTASVGRPPVSFSASYLWGGSDNNQVTGFDQQGHTLQQFTLEPFVHLRSLALPLPDTEQGVLGSKDGRYFVTTGTQDYAIVKADGSVRKNPEELIGNIKSVAYTPEANVLVIEDEFQSLASMALLTLNASGDVTGSWRAGTRFPGDKDVITGTMLADGRLVLGLGTGTIAVVKTADSIANQTWEFSAFDVKDAQGISWLAAVPGLPNAVMALDGTRALAIDVSSGTVLDQMDLKSFDVLGMFRDYTPHLALRTKDLSGTNASLTTFTYLGPEGKFLSKSLRGSPQQITQTLLDITGSQLTVVYNPDQTVTVAYSGGPFYARQQVIRFRLSDNLPIDLSEFASDVNVVILPSYLVALYPAALGKAARINYGREPDTKEVEGYNLSAFVHELGQ